MTGVEKVQAPRNRNTRDGRSRAVEVFETAQHRVLSRYGIAAESRFIDVPAIGGKAHVQLIWGDRDPFGFVDVARRSAGLLPDVELHVVAGGHAPWLNRAEQVGTLARQFLHDHPPRRSS